MQKNKKEKEKRREEKKKQKKRRQSLLITYDHLAPLSKLKTGPQILVVYDSQYRNPGTDDTFGSYITTP